MLESLEQIKRADRLDGLPLDGPHAKCVSGKRDLEIGMLPVMLRSNLCVLNGKGEEETLSI